ncbi:hypothetical protein OK351_04610 [Glutamicibacter sp. MNS18]|uniref:hypothetical protein n=1 Tax=Glutamicibacter sp. MNS18 TaxID=2989817 RepID=UPI00223561EA|nr:hypothetical protein [Glutamicibacter sp. MNS18]MCW4464787.1 hypothetical protein [Glutamicibacter sp. MNS18]
MKKIIWVAIGVGVGVLAAKKYQEISSGTALNRQVGKYADRLSDIAEAFRDGMSQREEELRTALGVDQDTMKGSPSAR